MVRPAGFEPATFGSGVLRSPIDLDLTGCARSVSQKGTEALLF